MDDTPPVEQPTRIDLIFTIISLFITFIMVFIHEYHVEKKISKSRGFVAGIFIGLIFLLFIIFIACYALTNVTNFEIVSESIKDNFIHLINIFSVVGFFFGITIFSLPYINTGTHSRV